MPEIKRLHLADMTSDGETSPVHGFVVMHAGGALLVDTGVGGPQDVLNDWRVVNRTVTDALADIDMSPADISLVINVLLGDAAYTTEEFSGPQALPDGQASDRAAWDASLARIKTWGAARFHFCHDTAVLHS